MVYVDAKRYLWQLRNGQMQLESSDRYSNLDNDLQILCTETIDNLCNYAEKHINKKNNSIGLIRMRIYEFWLTLKLQIKFKLDLIKIIIRNME